MDRNRDKDAPSKTARRIGDELIDKTGKAAGDTEKPVQKTFDELGERLEVKRSGGRE